MENYSFLITKQNITLCLTVLFLLFSLITVRVATGCKLSRAIKIILGKSPEDMPAEDKEDERDEEIADNLHSELIGNGNGIGTVSSVLVNNTRNIIESGIIIEDSFSADLPEYKNIVGDFVQSPHSSEHDKEVMSELVGEATADDNGEDEFIDDDYDEPALWNCKNCGYENPQSCVCCLNCGTMQAMEEPDEEYMDDEDDYVPLACPNCEWVAPESLYEPPKHCGRCGCQLTTI